MDGLLLAPYHSGLLALLALAALMVVQFAVADLTGIRAKHEPGTPVAGGHGSFLFRATRTYANSNENLGLLLLLVVVCFFTAAAAPGVNALLWGYFAARVAYTVCYYADWRTLRSIVFGLGALAQVGLLILAVAAVY